MIKVLIAPNSFKECSSSVNISDLILTSFKKYLPSQSKDDYSFSVIPISDGGDGFLEVCDNKFDLTYHTINLTAPYLQTKIDCKYGYDEKSKTVYIESALILGMNVVPVEKRNPMILSSIGIGELLKYLAYQSREGKIDIKKAVIGIGGTGTNDLGMGACEIFGLKMFDKNGSMLSVLPKNFIKAQKVTFIEPELPFELEIILDVENPLFGSQGATKTFGIQKGLRKEELEVVEKGFQNILTKLGITRSEMKTLSGAGGGLAAGLKLFFNAKSRSATQFLRKDLGINNEKYKFDIVITGEGKFDDQSMLSKGTMIVLNEYKINNPKRFVLCGISDVDDAKIPNLSILELQKFFISKEESMRNFELGIELGVKKIINDISNKN